VTNHLTVLVDRACRGVASPTEAEQLRAGVAALQQRFAEMRALHATELGNEYGGLECAVCREVWPCATIATLDGPDAAPPERGKFDEHGYLASRLAQVERQLALAQARIAELHEGEEPYDDERIVPSPSQWLWQWNRATPEKRLAKAAQVLVLHDRLDLVQQALVCHGDRPSLADAVRAALDGHSPDVRPDQP
jgi:hypothetical protein